MANLLLINGGLRGAAGNSGALLRLARRYADSARVRELVLATYDGTAETLREIVTEADALIFASGVYWNAYGSPLQRFIEVMTSCEVTDVFFGKPAGVLLSMDSVGGTDVAARLLGVLNLFGCAVPPLGTVVLSRVGAQASATPGGRDVWGLEDIGVLVHNVLAMARQRPEYRRWEVQPTATVRGAYPAGGILNVDGAGWVDDV